MGNRGCEFLKAFPDALRAAAVATRSPDRSNPIGLHRAKVLSVGGDGRLPVDGLEAIDGTPILGIKPGLSAAVRLEDPAVPLSATGWWF
jgi:tRNA (Thr-GGU) A37 N-methylase